MLSLLPSMIVVGGLLIASKPDTAIKVRPLSITETRHHQIMKLDESLNSMQQQSELTLEVLLVGKATETVGQWGDVKLETAVDDQGNPLTVRKIAFGSDPYADIDRDSMWFFADEPPKDQIRLKIPFDHSKRGATTIARLKGTMTLVDVETARHELDELETHVGDAIFIDVLKPLNASVRLTKFSPGESHELIELEVRDPDDVVSSFDFVDAAGEVISTNSSWFGFGDQKTWNLGGSESLPPGANLRVSIVTGTRKIVVPFDFSDIGLP